MNHYNIGDTVILQSELHPRLWNSKVTIQHCRVNLPKLGTKQILYKVIGIKETIPQNALKIDHVPAELNISQLISELNHVKQS